MAAPSTSPTPLAGFAVLVPVKPPAVGKSRLSGLDGLDGLGGLGDEERPLLARAFALDTVTAALAARQVAAVLVVTDDAAFSAEVSALGCRAIPDGVSLDLNGTLRQAAAEASRRWPELTPVALCADLPALRPDELDEALREIAAAAGSPGWRGSFVADTEGLGTTLYAAPYAAFDPQFGVGSAATHGARGALAVSVGVPTLRRDVDDLDDLAGAMAHGLGSRTVALTGRSGPGGGVPA